MTKSGARTDKKFRTLCHSRIYDAQYRELSHKFDLEDAVEGLKWLICQVPYDFPPWGNGYYIGETTPSIRVPPLRVLFLVMNDDLVKLCFIEEQTIEELDESF
jgi:hypothetical protein